MQFEKRAVRLGDIRPSGQNPREDFGDIGALARSIEATGGEPLNPPVVVADGNVYRIVDGERRYRALSSLYGEDREVSALVADTMDEANELVFVSSSGFQLRQRFFSHVARKGFRFGKGVPLSLFGFAS